MNILNTELTLPEGDFDVEVIEFVESDRQKLHQIYEDWISLSNNLRSLHSRAVNLPEGLSESAFCLEMGFVRVISNISGANSSWDCYDPAGTKRIQVKACSILPDLSSFGPTSQWDQIYFVDFYRSGPCSGCFSNDIYKILS
jgi:hypothetical protein